jgi:hypothetical protein
MGGAPIDIVLYANGIHIPYARQELHCNPALERRLGEAFDRGDQTTINEITDSLLPLIDVAIDTIHVADGRPGFYPPTPASPPGQKSTKRGKKKKK